MILRRSSLTCSLNEDDDGFLEVLDDCEEECEMPMGMASLLTAPLVRDNAAADSVRASPRGRVLVVWMTPGSCPGSHYVRFGCCIRPSIRKVL